MLNIMVVDDHPMVREGLRALIQDLADMRIVAEALDGQEALNLLPAHDVDVVVLDLTMPVKSGLDTLLHIKRYHPKVRVLILTLHSKQQYGRRLLRAGAYGYLSKESLLDHLEAAIRAVAQGRRYVPPALAKKLAVDVIVPNSIPPHAALSDREYEIFLQLAQGRTLKEIAARLALSPKTVMTYRLRISEKMKMRATADFIRYAATSCLLDQPLVLR